METAVLMDVDATLTPPRQPLNEEVANVLKHINIPFYLVAGSHLSILQKQFFEPLYKFGFRKQFETFISNGAILYRCDYSSGISVNLVSEFNFREYLGDKDYNFLVNVLEKTLKTGEFKMPNSIKIIGNRIVDRVSMINFCPMGRDEKSEDKAAQDNRKNFVAFDKENNFRQRVMNHLNRELSDLISDKKLKITLGGQTSFDIGVEGKDKTNALYTLLERGFDRIVFIGDALFEGGNDAVMREFVENWPSDNPCPVETIQTSSWKKTIEILRKLKFVS